MVFAALRRVPSKYIADWYPTATQKFAAGHEMEVIAAGGVGVTVQVVPFQT
nr:hypothetical protein GCM10020063_092390 [Dactylosporangium thailandense]